MASKGEALEALEAFEAAEVLDTTEALDDTEVVLDLLGVFFATPIDDASFSGGGGIFICGVECVCIDGFGRVFFCEIFIDDVTVDFGVPVPFVVFDFCIDAEGS